MRRLLIGWAALLVMTSVHAATIPLAHYKLMDSEALGQVQGPETLENSAGDRFALTRDGAPRYMNVPPDVSDGRALLFDGKCAYRLKGGVPGVNSGFVLEAWARAAEAPPRITAMSRTTDCNWFQFLIGDSAGRGPSTARPRLELYGVVAFDQTELDGLAAGLLT